MLNFKFQVYRPLKCGYRRTKLKRSQVFMKTSKDVHGEGVESKEEIQI